MICWLKDRWRKVSNCRVSNGVWREEWCRGGDDVDGGMVGGRKDVEGEMMQKE